MRGADRRRTGRARRLLITAVAVAAVAAGAVAATGIGLHPSAGTSAAPSTLPPATAQVTRQTLVDTQSESGLLTYGDETAVAARLPGTVTSLPVAGSVVRRGQSLYGLDDAPVLLLYGTLPAYRALTVGTKGDDVQQFEQNLHDLGYTGFTVQRTFTEATAAAVRRWQKALGLPRTGAVELGRVWYAPGPVRVATDKANLGDATHPGDQLETVTGTARRATVDLSVSDARLAVVGAAVGVTLPDGRVAPGRISTTRTYVDTGSGSGGGSGGSSGSGSGSGSGSNPTTKIEVQVAFDDPAAATGLDQASVDVAFSASKRPDVLTVPVAALLSLAEGGYGLQVVEGTRTRTVTVRTGLFADGRVEISGGGITAGTTVGMPS